MHEPRVQCFGGPACWRVGGSVGRWVGGSFGNEKCKLTGPAEDSKAVLPLPLVSCVRNLGGLGPHLAREPGHATPGAVEPGLVDRDSAHVDAGKHVQCTFNDV